MPKREIDIDSLRILAVRYVLNNLGEESLSLIEQYLMNVYGISVRNASMRQYSFEQLMEALTNLLVERTTKIIIESIYLEIDEHLEMLRLMNQLDGRHKFSRKKS
jgi:hypothetical protein